METVSLGGRLIGDGQPCLIVAENPLVGAVEGDGIKRVYQRELPILKNLRRVGAAV